MLAGPSADALEISRCVLLRIELEREPGPDRQVARAQDATHGHDQLLAKKKHHPKYNAGDRAEMRHARVEC